MKFWTMLPSGQLHLPAKVCPVQSGTATLKEKHIIYCIGSKTFTTAALQKKYMSSLITIGSRDQQGCGNVVTVVIVHHVVYTPVQCMSSIQIWYWPVHSRLAIMPQPCREPRPRNIRHKCKYTYHKHISRCPHIHIYKRHKNSNRGRCQVADATKVFN